MNDQLYRDIILEHWKNPQNYGVVQNADLDVEQSNPYCGDRIRLTIKLADGKIKEISFNGEGCAISKASASLFTEEIKGKFLADLKTIESKDVLALLGIILTPTRTKCALLVFSTLNKGLEALYLSAFKIQRYNT